MPAIDDNGHDAASQDGFDPEPLLILSDQAPDRGGTVTRSRLAGAVG